MFRQRIKILIKKYFLFSLRSTIISLFLPVIIIFIAIMGWVSYMLAAAQLEENAYKNIDDTVFQTKAYLENRLSDVFEQLVTFSNNPQTLSIINSESAEIRPTDYIDMSNLLKTIHLNNTTVIDSIFVDMHHGTFSLYRSDYSLKNNQFPYSQYNNRYNGNREGFYWQNVHTDDIFQSNAKVVSLFKLIGNNQSKANGVLLFNLRNDFFEKVLNKSLIGEQGYITLLSPDGYMNSKNVTGEYSLDAENAAYLRGLEEESGKYQFQNIDGKKMMVVYDTIGINKWKIAAIFPVDEILKKANYIKYVTIVVIITLTGIAILLANFFARYISNPVSSLVNQTKLISENHLELKYDHRGPQEIQFLNIAIEDLMVRVNDLLNQIRLEQEEKRQLEFAILHAQINPHFLYNTLYSIKGLCDMGLNKDASSMITALSNFFRISISQGQEIITINEEITHIKNYLYIQEMRYGDDFSYEIEIGETILTYKIIKLTLQPLIENAIYHGVKQTRGKGKITIKGYESGENICLEVIDNGTGMSTEKLQAVRKELYEKRSGQPTIGIGLRSVHERLQMHFGEPYGLVLESGENIGTNCLVVFPKLKGGLTNV
ncbi:sensor histidine kinase [Neobacillus novalis]|uniref:Sensor histidine kinase n=1 Tax=Neobacillus novalis TaxID=220687 RepID=A0AA95MN61_9BACI|nr:sensor histidine kinase [Neobacillus novalis]WHY85073.1 sensor histidine kinase [Neobacillus novalis]